MNELIYKHTLHNAIKYEGKANPGAIIGKVLSENPELKKDMKYLSKEISEIIKKVNSMKLKDQIEELKKLAPELLEEKKVVEERRLPPLKNVKNQVILRIAPYPSGPLHIGNAKQVVINDEYAKIYKGKLILVIDDTIGSEEKNIEPDAYRLIPEGLEWLNINFDKNIVYKSDRLEIYYKHAEELIKKGMAYTCKCLSEILREKRAKGIECSCRKSEVSNVLSEWYGMLKGNYKEGQIALRLKTSMNNPNPAFRDRVLFRISERTHPRVGNKYKVWPMLEFSWAVDDYLLKITHVIRGKELMIESDMEKFIWDIFKWKGPELIHTGLLTIEGVKLSKSKSKSEVKSGKYFGWDDPRTWSLQSLKRRGFKPEAVRNFILSFGVNEHESMVSVDKFYSESRKLIESEANRYFLIEDPIEIEIKNSPEQEIELKLHPDFPERGFRKYDVSNKFYISKKDFDNLKDNKINRLMDCLNFVKKKNKFIFDSNNYMEK
ncbi:glutamate--tRNA ligase [Candidatus Woesearchaeota archaeon]|nr:glutamate--tRNA ligase [Candidatus Woesearchaeota archaeon]